VAAGGAAWRERLGNQVDQSRARRDRLQGRMSRTSRAESRGGRRLPDETGLRCGPSRCASLLYGLRPPFRRGGRSACGLILRSTGTPPRRRVRRTPGGRPATSAWTNLRSGRLLPRRPGRRAGPTRLAARFIAARSGPRRSGATGRAGRRSQSRSARSRAGRSRAGRSWRRSRSGSTRSGRPPLRARRPDG
jgi:hypothetical protein